MDRTTIDFGVSAAARKGAAGRRQASPAEALRRLIAWFRNEYRIRRTIDELMALDDDRLADVGLTRGNIEHAVRYSRSRGQTAALPDDQTAQGTTHTTDGLRFHERLRKHG